MYSPAKLILHPCDFYISGRLIFCVYHSPEVVSNDIGRTRSRFAQESGSPSRCRSKILINGNSSRIRMMRGEHPPKKKVALFLAISEPVDREVEPVAHQRASRRLY